MLRTPSNPCSRKAWPPLCCCAACPCRRCSQVSTLAWVAGGGGVCQGLGGSLGTQVHVFTESKMAAFWTLILDEKKPLFTTEKFLSQASEEGGALSPAVLLGHIDTCMSADCILIGSFPGSALCTVLQLCERLFLDHAHRLTNSKSQ